MSIANVASSHLIKMAQPGASEPGGSGPGSSGPGAQPGQFDEPGGSNDNNNDNTYINDNNVSSIICICGKPFQEINEQNCYSGQGVACDLCGNSIKKNGIVYHCPDGKSKVHEGGYDLCTKCATKEIISMSQQMNTEGGPGDNNNDMDIDDDGKPKLLVPTGYVSENHNPPCICGLELMQTPANKAYKQTDVISCDNCSKKCKDTEPIYHCLDEFSKKHEGGYDLCFDCGWKYTEYKMDEVSTTLTMGNDDNALMFAPGTAGHSEKIQTEALIPICICGDELLKTDSRVYGEESGGVICDNCRVGCQGDDIVYHCMRGHNAPEHKGGFDLCEKCAMKQNKKVRTNWLSDLFEDMVVTIARFVINKRPSSVMILKSINKYWYQALNPNKPNVNALWQHNICRPMFQHIPKNLKIKRWDRYYQYRYHSILRYRKNNNDRTKINKKLVYTKYKMIENCTHDFKELDAFYRDPYSFQVDNSVKIKKKGKKKDIEEKEDLYDGYFDAQFGSHGLPKGYKWKMECPVLAVKLKKRGDDKYYCNVCKKNVYIVENEQEMKQRVEKGQCIQYTMSGKPSKKPVDSGHQYPTPRPVRRGKVAYRR
eukprot:297196_1